MLPPANLGKALPMSEFSDRRRRYRDYVRRENMQHFMQIMKSETDPAKRKIIQELILDHYERFLKPDEGDPGTKTN